MVGTAGTLAPLHGVPLPPLALCPPWPAERRLPPQAWPASAGMRPPIPFAPAEAAARPTDTLIVSDLHLGLPDSRPGDLLEFLVERPFHRLILLGDVLHDPSFRHLDGRAWRLLHHIRRIHGQPGREVVWLFGNHDRTLAAPIARRLGIAGRESFAWEEQGRRCLALHGDCFDGFLGRHRRLGQLCSDVFAFAQRGLAPYHGWLARLDDWQIRVTGLADKVVAGAVRHAAASAFDLVVCGHSHAPVRRHVTTPTGVVTYANAGHWLGSPASFVTVGPNGLGLDFLP